MHHDFVMAVTRALEVFRNKPHYERLRQNAATSVLDNTVVARAWGHEFTRLRYRLWCELEDEETEAEAKK
eukprot:EC786358.1.p1 GENE.EC786358.1~~EC786358.1.p1  ORF type:complete len:70 (+),score=31.89 EC786358.1:206-415(+)